MRLATLLLGLLLVPTGLAAETLSLESHQPVRLAGSVEVLMTGGSLMVNASEAPGPIDLVVVAGRASLWTWKLARAQLDVAGSGYDVAPQPEDAAEETFDLANATIRVDPGGGPFRMVAQAREDGVVSVSGILDEEGMPQRIPQSLTTGGHPLPPLRRLAEDVPWGYERGWTYSGNVLVDMPPRAFPFPDAAKAHLEGDILLKVSDGLVEFQAADGRMVRASLGARPDPSGAPVETHRRLVVEGRLARSEVPAGEAWGITGPDPKWAVVNGRVEWRNATGEIRSEGEIRKFHDRAVEAAGTLLVDPDGHLRPQDASEADLREPYEAEGSFAARLDGTAVVRPGPASVPVPLKTAGLLVGVLALLALAWKIAVAFYTRLDPQDALEHPRRRAIHEAVREHPGERVREVQRRVGLAWGAFSFHLDVLRRTGHVHLVREGAYLLVVPTVPSRGAPPLIAHPRARAVYDALPLDGSAVALKDLRDRLGFSRQLLDHHLQALVARGIVEVVRRPDGARDVRRSPAPTTTGHSA